MPNPVRALRLWFSVVMAVAANGSAAPFAGSPSPRVQGSSAAVNVGRTGAATAPLVSVSDVNPGGTLARGGCIRFSAGPGAEGECGDLVYVHGLPATRVLNRTYAPMLVYNGATAYPHPVVRANVTVPATAGAPTRVTAALFVDGSLATSNTWSGSAFTPGQAKRIALGYDAANASQGLHPYTLQVTSYYGSTGYQTTVTDTLAIVNRIYSPFGSGWWLNGLESITSYGNLMLWIGGDGSTRVYRPTGTGWGPWTAEYSNGVDSLVYVATPTDGTAAYYARKLRGGGEVRYAASTGQQIATVNRLGFVTTFTWETNAYNGFGVRLTGISLPVKTGDFNTGLAYTFGYAAANVPLSSVTAPPLPGQPRVVQLRSGTGWDVTAITDEDGSKDSLFYDGGLPHRVSAIRDARGTWTTYTYAASNKLSQVRRYAGGGTSTADDPVTTYNAPENQGYMGAFAPDTAYAYATIDGPRLDVQDNTYVWVNRWGAPAVVEDALANRTWLYREDGRFPETVTEVNAPGGGSVAGGYGVRTIRVAYLNGRGNPDSTIVFNPLGDGQNAVTRITYGDSRWPDLPTQVTSPTGLVSLTGYDSITGNRTWQQTGTDASRRVWFGYNSRGQVTTVRSARAAAAGDSAEKIEYLSPLGNLSAVVSPLGIRTTYADDAIGRDTLVVAPISQAAGTQSVQRSAYDVAGRVLTSSTTALGQTVTVGSTYDPGGLVLTTTRTMSPDTNHIGAMTITYRYDALGRTLREIAPDGWSDSLEYDPAGQVVTRVTRRSSRLGPTNLVMTYDALGHLLTRITPSFAYSARHLADFGRSWDFPYQPLNPDNPSSPTVLSGDTAVFTYDGAGNVLTANNHDARVTRTYLPGGALASETQAIRTYTGADFSQHVFTVGYRYDLEGRRVALKHPASLAPAAGQDSVAYGYDPATGDLTSVVDPLGNVFGFRYDADGRMWQRTAPGGVMETNAFDADDRLIRRTLAGSAVGTLFADTLQYDDRGKVTLAGGSDAATATYTGMGALKRFVDQNPDRYSDETRIIDPLGNLAWNDRHWVDPNAEPGKQHTQQTYTYQAATGRQREMDEVSALDGHVTAQDLWDYDAAGNRDWHLGSHPATSDANGTRLMQERTQSYYGADDRLRVVDRQRCLTQVMTGTTSSASVICGVWNETLGQDPSAFEEYRYDALGRRVLVRRRLYEVNGSCAPLYHTCNNAVERFVYDGDQILWEIRTPTSASPTAAELESDAGTGDFGGRVGYTQGGGMDAPLDLIRIGHRAGLLTIVPHANWRGMYATGTLADGTTAQGTFSTGQIAWPGPNADAWHNPIAPGQPSNWFGSLIVDQRDASGHVGFCTRVSHRVRNLCRTSHSWPTCGA